MFVMYAVIEQPAAITPTKNFSEKRSWLMAAGWNNHWMHCNNAESISALLWLDYWLLSDDTCSSETQSEFCWL